MRRLMWLTGLLLAWSVSAASAAPYLYDVQPGVTVVGWNRLSPDAQTMLQQVLSASPRSLTPWLRVITVDGSTIPEPLASETCAPNNEFLYAGPCRFNAWSSTSGGENPFPDDAPESVWVNGFVAVVNHEYAHQIGHGTAVEQAWVDGLIVEAGDDPQHYLHYRSMVEWGYFRRNPQEFVASLWNQWGTCSRCTLRLALARWDAGNPHPLNQVILLLALSGFRHGYLDDDGAGSVVAHRIQDEVPIPEFWSVRPWRCDGPVTITGPTFRVGVTLDRACRVTKVMEREGL